MQCNSFRAGICTADVDKGYVQLALCVHGAAWSFQAGHAAFRRFADAHVVPWQVTQLSHKACWCSSVLDGRFGSRLLQQCCFLGWMSLILDNDSS